MQQENDFPHNDSHLIKPKPNIGDGLILHYTTRKSASTAISEHAVILI
jgi:hypothetical protein